MRGVHKAILSATAGLGILLSGCVGIRLAEPAQRSLPYFSQSATTPAEANAFEAAQSGVDEAYADRLAEYRGSDGKPFFSAKQIIALWEKHGKYTRTGDIELEISETRDHRGRQILEGDDVQAIFSLGQVQDFRVFWRSPNFAEYRLQLFGLENPLGVPLLSSRDVYYAHSLRLMPGDFRPFTDTEKPNALVVMPENDYNGAFAGADFRTFINGIKAHYDTTFAFSSHEWDLYCSMRDLPALDLLVVSGHGQRERLTFRNARNDPKGMSAETATLDTTDLELGKYLRKMHLSGTVVLYSCSTAEEPPTTMPESSNLATVIGRLADPRQVFAARDLLVEVQITQPYPFDCKMKNPDGVNITYCSR